MKKENTIEDSMFYKQNMKIQRNIGKVYALVLLVSLMVIIVKGFN